MRSRRAAISHPRASYAAAALLVAATLCPRPGQGAAADAVPAAAAVESPADPTTVLARRLATLRGRVDELQNKLGAEREELRARQRSAASQRLDLEANLRRERQRQTEAERMLAEKKAALADAAAKTAALVPAVRAALATVRSAVAAGLPFRQQERLAALDAIDARLADGTLGAGAGLARLWAAVEDELRLGRSNELQRQPLALPGGERLCDVVRLGGVALYFRTPDGQAGLLRRGADGSHTPVLLRDPVEVQAVLDLVDAFERRVRTGLHRLPTPFEGKLP